MPTDLKLLLTDRIAGLAPSARRSIYDEIRAGLQAEIRAAAGAMSIQSAIARRRELETTIIAVEKEALRSEPSQPRAADMASFVTLRSAKDNVTASPPAPPAPRKSVARWLPAPKPAAPKIEPAKPAPAKPAPAKPGPAEPSESEPADLKTVQREFLAPPTPTPTPPMLVSHAATPAAPGPVAAVRPNAEERSANPNEPISPMEFLARLFPERPLASTPANDSDKIDAAPFERVRSELAAGGSAESELVILKGEAGTAPPHEPARGLPDVPEGPGPVSPETGPDVVEIPAAIRLAETKFDDLELSAPTAMAVKAYKAPAPPAEGASALDEPVAIASESESESPSINQPVLGEPHGETLRPSDPEPEAPPGLLDEVAGERAEGWRRRPLLVYLAVLALAVVAVALAAAIVGIGFDLAEKRTTAREVAARNGPVPAGPVAELIRGAGFQTAAQEALSKGNAHLESGDFERAISAYDDAIRLDPATPAAYGNRAFAYWSLGNAQAAIRDYGAAIERDPTNVVNRLNRAIAYNREGEHRLAIDDLNRVLVAQPANAAALNSRCWAHAVLAHLQEALADCDEALKLRPDDPDVLDSRGFVYLRLGRLDRAIADYNAVLKLQPKHSGALYGRGLAKIGRGDRGGGREDVSAAQAIDPDIVDTFARYGVR